ncbi:MAG: HAMP domain-containing sensor histidine kinase [Geminicoccaceae bacterium]
MLHGLFKFIHPYWTITANAVAGIVIALATIFASFHLDEAHREFRRSSETHVESLFVIEELRQSSDDLTRLARTFVLTGNKRYRQQYDATLAIRRGAIPRPEHYQMAYWDLLFAGAPVPHAIGTRNSIVQRARSLGFTETETAHLLDALDQSNALSRLEIEVMDLPEIVSGGPPASMDDTHIRTWMDAVERLHGDDYHTRKSRVMTAVNALYRLVSDRGAVHLSGLAGGLLRAEWLMVVCIGLLATFVVASAFVIRQRFVRPLETIGRIMANMHQDSLDTSIPFQDRADEIGMVARGADRFRKESARMLRVDDMEFVLRVVYHDVKQPVKRMAALAQLQIAEAGECGEGGFAHEVNRSCHGLVELIDSLRDLVRIGASAGNRTGFELKAAWTDAVADALHGNDPGDVVANGIDGLTLAGDRSLIVQFFVNLLRNAQLHGSRTPEITFSSQWTGNGRVFSVSNRIDAIVEDADSLFEPFNTRNRVASGTSGLGLGLAICKRIVDLHGGEIRIDQETPGIFAVLFTLPEGGNEGAGR